jgi:hypothetical protein
MRTTKTSASCVTPLFAPRVPTNDPANHLQQ